MPSRLRLNPAGGSGKTCLSSGPRTMGRLPRPARRVVGSADRVACTRTTRGFESSATPPARADTAGPATANTHATPSTEVLVMGASYTSFLKTLGPPPDQAPQDK